MGIVTGSVGKITRGDEKMKSHEDTIEDHVDSNVSMAIDQADEYGGLAGACDSFYQNTVDSALEDGYTAGEAMEAGEWFIVKFRKKTGLAV